MAIHNPLHPGKIIEEILFGEDSPYKEISEAAHALGVHRVTLSRLINQHSSISPEMAVRLAVLLKTSVDMWLGIQCDYDVAQAKKMLKQMKKAA
jgi:addiction module HigA family antidote